MLVNVVNEYCVDYIMPISKVDENLERGHKRDAVNREKFWFRKNILKGGVLKKRPKDGGFLVFEKEEEEDKDELVEMSLS